MKRSTLKKIVALGAVTGMRSMAGIAALRSRRGGAATSIAALAAVGEFVADKTPFVGNRIDALPLAGRVIIGAGIGAFVAREEGQDALVGGLLGAATAVVAAHLAYHGRKRLPLSAVTGGLVEDSLVLAIASRYA
jgi:uncharacterized membrane protein